MITPVGMNDDGQVVIDGTVSFMTAQEHIDLNNMITRMTTAEAAIANQGSRITTIENWLTSPATYLGTPIAADLTTNYNVVTTLLGALVGAVNATNIKVNAIISGKITPLQSGLQSKGLFATS